MVTLLTILASKTSQVGSQAELDSIVDSHFARTLGGLRSELYKQTTVSDEEAKQLNSLVALRNELAHRYWRKNFNLVSTSAGRKSILKYLHEAEIKFVQGLLLVDDYIVNFLMSKNVADSDVDPYALEAEKHKYLLNHLQTTW